MIHRWRWVLVLWFFGGIAAAAPAADSVPPPAPGLVPFPASAPAHGPVPPPPPVDGPLPEAVVEDPGHAAVAPGYIPAGVSLRFPSPITCPAVPLEPPKHGCARDFWVRAEYLLWWMKDAPNSLPLLTLGSTGGPPPGINPQTLFGGKPLDLGEFSGLRLTVGEVFNDVSGLELRAWFLAENNFRYSASSDGSNFPILSQPFVAVSPTGAVSPGVALIAAPGVRSGDFQASESQMLWGGEINWVGGAIPTAASGMGWIFGMVLHQLNGNLIMITHTRPLPGNTLTFLGTQEFSPSVFTIYDQFRVNNWFLGPQVGASYRWTFESWYIDLHGTLALGSTQQESTISGYTNLQLNPNSTPILALGGLYAQGSNIGKLERSHFAYIPSIDLRAGWNVTSWCIATLGYNFMYWSSVGRPGDQISPLINVTQPPTSPLINGIPSGPLVPQHTVRGTDFWAQGLTVGLEFRF